MPSARMGEATNLDRQQFFQLKGKGEKATLRFASLDYHYDGQHFIAQEGSDRKMVTPCPRINNQGDCMYCNKYFELSRAAKEIENEVKRKEAFDAARQAYGVALTFYYPVLNRTTKAATIFKTKLSIRKKLETEVEEGVDVLKFDWVVTRTENPGSEYYTLKRVDSAEMQKLDADEKAELEKAKALDLDHILNGTSDIPDEDGSVVL